tara:strand:- start:1973 stop:2611 length:639 start_codon:yes stop_codon:yes gene_type:complete
MSFKSIKYLIITFLLSYEAVIPRDFSKNLEAEYKKMIATENNSQISTTIACVNSDILVLLMSEALNFDMTSMQKVSFDASLYIEPEFYQNWKRNLLGQMSTGILEDEIIKLEKLENIKLVDVQNSRKHWKKLLEQTEEIINKVAKNNGYLVILKQNTIPKLYSYQNLSKYSVVSANIPNITLSVAKQVLQSRGLSSNHVNKILKLLELNFTF